MEQKYCDTLVSSRDDRKLAYTDNLYDKDLEEFQDVINKRVMQLINNLNLDIKLNDKGQYIWTIGDKQFILTPYMEEQTVVETKYGEINVTNITYSNNGNMNAAGDKLSVINITFRQKAVDIYTNGTRQERYIDGNLQSEGVQVTYTLDRPLNDCSINDDGSVEASASTSTKSQTIGVVRPNVTWHGQTSNNTTISAAITQAAARVSFNETKDSITDTWKFDASGGDNTITIYKTKGVTIDNIVYNSQYVHVSTDSSSDDRVDLSIDVQENESTSDRNFDIKIYTNIGTLTANIEQKGSAEATIRYYIYGKPLITSFSYENNGVISEDGGANTLKISKLEFSQRVSAMYTDGEEREIRTDTGSFSNKPQGVSFNFVGSGAVNGAEVGSSNGIVSVNPSVTASSQNVLTVTPTVTWYREGINYSSENGSSFNRTITQSPATFKFKGISSNTRTINDILSNGEDITIEFDKSAGAYINEVVFTDGTEAVTSLVTYETKSDGNIVITIPNNGGAARSFRATISSNIGTVLYVNLNQKEYVAPKTFYIGSMDATEDGFAGKTVNNLINAANYTRVDNNIKGTGTVAGVDVSTYYKHTTNATGSILYLMIPADVSLGAARLVQTEGNQDFNINDIEDTDQWSAIHEDVTINNVVHKVYGIRDRYLAGKQFDIYVK